MKTKRRACISNRKGIKDAPLVDAEVINWLAEDVYIPYSENKCDPVDGPRRFSRSDAAAGQACGNNHGVGKRLSKGGNPLGVDSDWGPVTRTTRQTQGGSQKGRLPE